MPRSKGFRHSPETKAKIAKSVSLRSKQMWAAMSDEERLERRHKMSEGHHRQSDAMKKRRSYATSEGLKKYWSSRSDKDHKEIGQRLKAGRKQWKEKHPEEYAAVEAKRLEAMRRYHENISPEQKRERTERSIKGKLAKAQKRAELCPDIDWIPDEDRKQSMSDRLKRKAKGD